MDEAVVNSRLSRIETCWTLLGQAHGPACTLEVQAQAALIQRYQKAVYRYLLGVLKDQDAADDLFQEFALRMVRGDFHKADASKGKFRKYIKTAVLHLIHEYRYKMYRRTVQELDETNETPAPPAEDAQADKEFLASWRKTLLDRAWDALQSYEKPGGPPYFRALKLRTEHPEWQNGQIVAELARTTPDEDAVSEVALRKILQRARDTFTELLLDEISRSLGSTSTEALEEEVIDLGLQVYCAKALQKRRA